MANNKPSRQLSEVQLAVLRVLWRKGECTAADVTNALADDRGLAPTTVATLLKRLEKRGLVTYEKQGRQHLYRALISEEEARQSMLSEVTERLFEGNVSELLTHLLDARDRRPGDLARIKELIEAKERELEGS